MSSFDVVALETEEAAASAWTAAGVVAGVGLVALACD